jgi:hypothetical protein
MDKSKSSQPVSHTQPPRLRALDQLPGPPGLPFIGNVLQLEPKECHRLWSQWAEQYGALFVFRVGATRILTVADAELIQQLLRDRP